MHSTMNRTGKPIELDNIAARRIVAVRDADVGPAGINPNAWRYVWDAGAETTLDIVAEYPALSIKRVSDVLDDSCRSPRWFLMGVADCYDPAVFLVRADTESDALEIFETELEHLVRIEDSDLPDYGEDFNVNANGTPVDTESVFMHEMRVIEIRI